MYSVLNQSSLARSNTALECEMPFRSNSWISCWSPRISVAARFRSRSGRRPSQQRQKIAEGFGHDAFVAIGDHAGGAVALAEARLVRAENQRHVGEHRQRGAQRLVEQDLLGRIGNMIGAADDVGDAHVHIVGDHAQVIGGAAVGAQQHEVFQLSVGELHAAEDGVVESGAAGFGDGKAHGRGFSCGATPGAFLARNLPAGAFIARRTAFGGRSRAALLQFCLGAKTIVGMSGGQQLGRALRDTFPCAGSDGRDLRPSRDRASACPAECLPPFLPWSARDRCLQCAGPAFRRDGGQTAS